jgi:BASS family bile acid:Na+ symporter
MSARTIAFIVGSSVLVPLFAGLLVRRILPSSVGWARWISIAATVLLGLAFVPVLVTARYAVVAMLGGATLLAIAGFLVVSLAVGHLLGGPDPDERTVVGLSTASRHPGVALAIAQACAAEPQAVAAAILLCFLMGLLTTAPYVKWRTRARAKSQASAPA